MSKKTILSILVLILFAVVAVASSSSSKISEKDAYNIGYAAGAVLSDLSN